MCRGEGEMPMEIMISDYNPLVAAVQAYTYVRL